MILLSLAVVFVWLIYREITNPIEEFGGFSIAYISVLALLAFFCARPVYQTWRLEVFLSEIASQVAEREGVVVKCNSMFDTIFDGKGMESLAGTAYPTTGEIFFEHGWCSKFKSYYADPKNLKDDELFSMHVFTHEVMHIRGEMNEIKTDCQAVQRNHIVAQLMGVDRYTARQNALRFYTDLYPTHPYYNKECKRYSIHDERLEDPFWVD